MNKKAVGGAVVVVALALIIAGLATGAVYFSLEPPFVFFPEGYQVDSLSTPVAFGYANVYPNGSYTLTVWVYNPNPYPLDSGFSGVNEIKPQYGFWGPQGGLFNGGALPPFGFNNETEWSPMLVNGSSYNNGYPTYLQPASSGVLWYNGSGRFMYSLGYTTTWHGNLAAPALFQDFTYYGALSNGTHVWVLIPPHPVYKCEIPPGFPYPELVKINNSTPPFWWGRPAI